MIGGFRSDLSITQKTDGKFGNVSVVFSKTDFDRYTTRRSKIVSRATGRYAATSFDQLLVCPMSSFVGVAYFFLSPKAIARFRVFQKML